MKLNTLVFVLVLIGVLLIGFAIERYGRTCPGCQRRKKAMMAAVSSSEAAEAPIELAPSEQPDGPTIKISPIKPLTAPVVI